jgi:hypothetical protein
MSKKACRICLEEDEKQNLVSPCSCKGSSKYAHGECLMQWFLHQPSKGLFCSLCLDELSRVHVKPVEDTSFLIHFEKPFVIIYFYQYICFALMSKDAYVLSQVLLSVLFCAHNYSLYKRVKNKGMYLMRWMKKYRFLLPFLHLCVFFTIPYTYWVGGVSANIVMWMYLQEHWDILEEINSSNEVKF